MLKNDSSPSYEQLFGELDFRTDDDGRSVYSPAAYLVELLGLLEESFDRPSLLDRRPDLRRVLLDADNTFTETPYLDIVNEVLERLVGAKPYETLRTRIHPFGLPFSLGNERLKMYLNYLQVTPDELYRLFATRMDHDLAAREYLRLSVEDITVVTKELPDEAAVKTAYGLGTGDPPDGPQGVTARDVAQRLAGQPADRLSDVEDGRDNNGLFELRFDDDRYLPFEGTGAVSRWRLDTGSRRPPAALLDVTVTVKYTAVAGGDTFATAVKGLLKPYPAARYFDLATDFPDAWAEFQDDGAYGLILPLTPDLFPGMSGRQITGVYARYQLADGGTARFLLGGDKQLALTDGKLLKTPGLSLGAGGWTLKVEGDKAALNDVGLVLTYRAAG